MGYNNNNNYNNNRNNNGNWNNNRNNGGNWNGGNNGNWNNNNGYNNNNRQQSKKHSGAKMTRYTPSQGPNAGCEMTHVHGWTAHKGKGLVKYSCNTTSKSVLSDKGWLGSIACEVITENGQKSFYWGTMEYKTGKVVINDLALVINPKAKNGGYCGTFINN